MGDVDWVQFAAVYGFIAFVLLFVGVLIYTGPYATRDDQKHAARLIIAALVWPLALVVGGVWLVFRGLPRVFRDAFPKERK